MRATGIVRRVDDLGRVVIPKEIRRTMRIREGDPLEIFLTGEGGVTFMKYLPNEGYKEVLQKLLADMKNDSDDVANVKVELLIQQAIDALDEKEK